MLDTSMLSFLAPCFAASLILAGIHAYLGVHVVERGVIFVDLSLAQIAALGATIALLLPISNGRSTGLLNPVDPHLHARTQVPCASPANWRKGARQKRWIMA